MRGGTAGLRDDPRVHADAPPRQPHPIRHGRGIKLSARRRTVAPDVRVGIHRIPRGVQGPAVERRMLVLELFEDDIIPRGRAEPLLAGRHHRPAGGLSADGNVRSLRSQVDHHPRRPGHSLAFPLGKHGGRGRRGLGRRAARQKQKRAAKSPHEDFPLFHLSISGSSPASAFQAGAFLSLQIPAGGKAKNVNKM